MLQLTIIFKGVCISHISATKVGRKTVGLKHNKNAQVGKSEFPFKLCNQYESCTADSLNMTVIPRDSGLCWTREQIIILLAVLNELIVFRTQWTSHLHRCCICVIMASGLLAVGNDDFREVCHCVSGRLLAAVSHSFPRAAVRNTQMDSLNCHT